MADIYKQSTELKINNGFADGDTRIITIPNPRDDLTDTDIHDLATLTAATQPIIGDQTGSAAVNIITAKKVDTTTTTLDLTPST